MPRYGGEGKKKQANGFLVYGIVIFYKNAVCTYAESLDASHQPCGTFKMGAGIMWTNVGCDRCICVGGGSVRLACGPAPPGQTRLAGCDSATMKE